MIFLKRTLPVLICFVIGVIFLAQFFVPTRTSELASQHGSNTVKVVIGFSYLIGLYSLAHLHWQRIRRQLPGWGYSGLVFLGLVPMMVFGLAGELEKFLNLVLRVNVGFIHDLVHVQTYEADGQGTVHKWLFENVLAAAQSTMFSMLAFFIASAAYRTFRARTTEAAFLLVAAAIVILGRVPLAAAVSEWIPWAADQIMAYPNLAAKRGILIGVSLGMVGTALRVIFGIERAYIGGD